MKLSCEMVADLLPGYLDDTCSGESRQAVEEHLASCDACRTLVEELRAEPEGTAEMPALNEAEVLKKTSWVISKRAVGAAAGVTAIVIYWLIYFWQDHLADWGDYRFFSYALHEIWSAGIVVVPFGALIWLGVVLWRCIRYRTWHKNAVLLCVLLLIVAWQTVWFASQREMASTSTWGTVEFVDDEHILLKNEGEKQIILEVPPMVKGLLIENEVVYSVSYTHRLNDYDDCELEYITATDLPPDIFD